MILNVRQTAILKVLKVQMNERSLSDGTVEVTTIRPITWTEDKGVITVDEEFHFQPCDEIFHSPRCGIKQHIIHIT